MRKKGLISLILVSILILGGCQNAQKPEPKDDKPKQEEKKQEEKIDIVENERYVTPDNASNNQIKAFNALSEAVASEDNEKEAIGVAESFIYDFYSLKNKKNREDVGGLQYIPSDQLKRFIEYAKAYYYGNYPAIVNKYGQDQLPMVKAVEITSVEAIEVEYNGSTSDAYQIEANIEYEDSKVENLKEKVTLQVMHIHDYHFDKEKDYTKNGVIFEGEMKMCYRILSAK